MQKGYTHVCLVLDASGSMEAIKEDVKGSLLEFARSQEQEGKGEVVKVDFYRFSNHVEHMARDAALGMFPHVAAGYKCGGLTALYDAVCVGIDELGAYFASMPEEQRPEDVLFVIVTDGEENASQKFNSADVHERITRQHDVYKWEFIFLASGIDVKKTAAKLGVSSADAFESTQGDLAARMCSNMNERMSAIRQRRSK